MTSQCSQVGFAAIKSVVDMKQEDHQPSFFLAETLKYHFLLQQPVADHGIDLLESHVFNTEAHPLSMFNTPRFEELKRKAARHRR